MKIIRKTKTVEAILQLFKDHNTAFSVVDLVKRFKGKANKSTIYRILERLENQGFVHSFKGQDGLAWYAKCSSDCSGDHHKDAHPHFQCQECGKVECLPVSITIPDIKTHRIDTAEILLKGQCADCLG